MPHKATPSTEILRVGINKIYPQGPDEHGAQGTAQGRSARNGSRPNKSTIPDHRGGVAAQDRTRRHKIAQGSTRWHKTAQDGTRRHRMAQDRTRSHKMAQDRTRSHKDAQDRTRRHKIAQGCTRSHKVALGGTRTHKNAQCRDTLKRDLAGRD